MLKRSRWMILAQMLFDMIVINLATYIAWFIRYDLLDNVQFGEGFFSQPYDAYIPLGVGLAIVAIFFFRIEGIYTPARGRGFLDELYMLAKGTTIATLLTMAVTFVWRPLVYSRAMYVIAAFVVVVLLGLLRAFERSFRAWMRQRGRGVDRVLIVGAGEIGRALMRNIVAQPNLGYQVLGFLDDDAERGSTDIGRFKALGSTNQLPHLLREMAVDEVIVALPWSAREKIVSIMETCQGTNIRAKVVPDLFQLSLSRVAMDDVGGVPLIALREPSIGTVNSLFKRAFDIFCSSLILVLSSPLLLLTAIAIKLDSPGPVIFRQKRLGRNGRSFTAYKFRSMRQGAEEEQPRLDGMNQATAPLFKIRDDPRLTRVGKFIRRTSLDELPQLWNVIKGDMSLVGPRPPMVAEVEQYADWHMRRLEVSPGVTGLWQVSGRSELTFDEMVMLDIYYIENWSPWMDFYILLKTIPTVMLARGAY